MPRTVIEIGSGTDCTWTLSTIAPQAPFALLLDSESVVDDETAVNVS